MRLLMVLCIAAVLIGAPVQAESNCEIEAWRAYSPVPAMVMIEGSTTCAEGIITIRLYSGSGDSAKFVGVANGLVQGNSFQAVATNLKKPATMTIKYSITSP